MRLKKLKTNYSSILSDDEINVIINNLNNLYSDVDYSINLINNSEEFKQRIDLRSDYFILNVGEISHIQNAYVLLGNDLTFGYSYTRKLITREFLSPGNYYKRVE